MKIKMDNDIDLRKLFVLLKIFSSRYSTIRGIRIRKKYI